MTSSIDSKQVFDTLALERELAQALEDDRVYKKTDEMKKKAIRTATSYDDFKNLVACADLKPMNQREIQSGFSMQQMQKDMNIAYKRRQATNGFTARSEKGGATFQVQTPTEPARRSIDFIRTWNRHCLSTRQKYDYLKLNGAPAIKKLFKADMDASLIVALLKVLSDTWKANTNDTLLEKEINHANHVQSALFAIEVMNALTKVGRFSLSIEFFDVKQKELVVEMVNTYEKFVNDHTCNFQLPEEDAAYAAAQAKLTEIRAAYSFCK